MCDDWRGGESTAKAAHTRTLIGQISWATVGLQSTPVRLGVFHFIEINVSWKIEGIKQNVADIIGT